MNIKTAIYFAAFSGIILLAAARAPVHSATLTINDKTTYQTIEGFGGGMVFNKYPYIHPKKNELYDSIFNVAGINILRIANWYDPQENNIVKEIPMVREIQKKWPNVKINLTSWSPPPSLKSNNSLWGYNNPSLKKNSSNTFMYTEYGDYWFKSLQHFIDSGVTPDWVSIQNEPDESPTYEGCVLDSIEHDTLASYGKALNAVYTKCLNAFKQPIRFIGPDVPGCAGSRMRGYLVSRDMHRDQLYAYCHHYYDYSGPGPMAQTLKEFNDKPIFQTEFLQSEGVDWTKANHTWFDHAKVINLFLAVENAQMYCLFALAYGPASTHCMFSMDTLGGDWYQARPTYYMFMHYSKFIHRGWKRVGAVTDDAGIASSGYFSPNGDSCAIVLMDTVASAKTVNYQVPNMTGEMYQTTDSVKFAHVQSLTSKGTISLPVRSITTLELHKVGSGVATPAPTAKSLACIDKISVSRTGDVSIGFVAPQSQAAIFLYDMRGHQVATGSFSGARQHGMAVFKNAVASGSYIAVFRSGALTITKNFAAIAR